MPFIFFPNSPIRHGRPRGRETLIGLPPEQQPVARAQFVELELRRFLVEERKRPMASLLENSVKRQVLGCDQSHSDLPSEIR
jgi:hypothetical protein